VYVEKNLAHVYILSDSPRCDQVCAIGPCNAENFPDDKWFKLAQDLDTYSCIGLSITYGLLNLKVIGLPLAKHLGICRQVQWLPPPPPPAPSPIKNPVADVEGL
jgi:hypothetical protein